LLDGRRAARRVERRRPAAVAEAAGSAGIFREVSGGLPGAAQRLFAIRKGEPRGA
jgi:hypothetical protein